LHRDLLEHRESRQLDHHARLFRDGSHQYLDDLLMDDLLMDDLLMDDLLMDDLLMDDLLMDDLSYLVGVLPSIVSSNILNSLNNIFKNYLKKLSGK
jgi:hypothetical protein